MKEGLSDGRSVTLNATDFGGTFLMVPFQRRFPMKKRSRPSPRFVAFSKAYPEIAASYEGLRMEVHAAGPLGNRDCALVKFAVSVGMRQRAGAYAHIRKAVDAGVTREQLEHVALLALPTVGLPAAMTALEWIDDALSKSRRKASR